MFIPGEASPWTSRGGKTAPADQVRHRTCDSGLGRQWVQPAPPQVIIAPHDAFSHPRPLAPAAAPALPCAPVVALGAQLRCAGAPPRSRGSRERTARLLTGPDCRQVRL